MPRVKPRTTIYGVLPILACVILAGAIGVTYALGIRQYQKDWTPRETPPPPLRENPTPEAPKAVAEEKIPGLTDEGKKEEKKEGKEEVAPGEGKEAPPAKAGEEKEAKDEKKESKEPAPEAPKEPKKGDAKEPKDDKKDAGGEKKDEEKK